MKKFIVRTLSGALFVAILVGSMLCGFNIFSPVFLAFMALAVNEFCTLLRQHKNATFSPVVTFLCSILLYVGFAYIAHNEKASALLALTPYMIAILCTFIGRMFSKKGNNIENIAYFALTQLYVALPFSLMQILSTAGAPEGETYHWLFPLSIFIFIWCNDSGAYCIAVAIGASVVMAHFFEEMSLWQWIGMAVVVVISGTLGDLVESSIKREMEIKDSGNFLPGHGGLLDRFDRTIFAIPSVIAYLAIIGIL